MMGMSSVCSESVYGEGKERKGNIDDGSDGVDDEIVHVSIGVRD